MKKYSVYILSLLFSSILTKASGQSNNDVQGSWSGFVKCVEKRSGKLGNSERTVFLTIKENIVSGNETYDEDVIIEGKFYQHNHCDGTGLGRLDAVSIYTSTGTYSIAIVPPECKSADPSHGADALVGAVEIADQRLQMKNGKLNINELSGIETRVSELPGGLMKTTTTITWQLVRDLDVELIVTPIGYDKNKLQKSYDDWLPEPGKDETTKGSMMKIQLSLKSKSGKPLKYKAQSFELKLSNTSIEPGITINYPVEPQQKQLPDLRFIPLAIAESDDEDQYITISSKSGISGETFIASYDGGGATTLTVEAVLDGDIHIKGQLLVSGGDEEIQIPKRVPGTMISTAWLTANGNPGEMDDKENSANNNFKGDGLTAYEEYRGVIAQGKFKRLDPKIKEVGIDVIKSELSYFSQGIKLFERASYLTAVIFHQDLNEIGIDRRLNKNTLTNHDYDQFVLRLYKSVIPSEALGKAYGGPAIPAKTFAVVIDDNAVQTEYKAWVKIYGKLNITLLYSLTDLINKTIAHELGHGVNCWHHGYSGQWYNNDIIEPSYANVSVHIFPQYNGPEDIHRPYPLSGPMGRSGNQESGDIACLMCYFPWCEWALDDKTKTWYYSRAPILPLGKIFCTSNQGTGFNAQQHYFGNSYWGNCATQIKLRD